MQREKKIRVRGNSTGTARTPPRPLRSQTPPSRAPTFGTISSPPRLHFKLTPPPHPTSLLSIIMDQTNLMQRLKPSTATSSSMNFSSIYPSSFSTDPAKPPPHPQSSHHTRPLFNFDSSPHRRSLSDIPFCLIPSPPMKLEADWDRELDSLKGTADQKKSPDEGDDLFRAYMNLDALNSSGANSSENEAESSSTLNESGSSGTQRKEGNKRTSAEMVGPRHCRSLSMDSFMGKLNFGEDMGSLAPCTGLVGQHSRTGSMDGVESVGRLEFANREFNAIELKKIMANEKLSEIALNDPKRVKRILANRQSAARSKERKMKYISELEHKVQALHNETTTLSAQMTLLQRDTIGLTTQNNELKFRLQAMEQQAHLKDALNEALTGEVQRLKIAIMEFGEAHLSNNLNQQIQLNPQIYRLQQQQQQSAQISLYQLQQQQQNNTVTKNETNK